MASGKSRVLVLGGTGYLGKRIVKASLREGHPTYALHRPEHYQDLAKIELLMKFRKRGVKLIEGSISDHESLVRAVKQVDVVISAVNQYLESTFAAKLEYQIIDAIKEAGGNIKRFVPAEYCMDPTKMFFTLEPAKAFNERLLSIREVLQSAKIPYTSIVANIFASTNVPNLCQLDTFMPPKDKVNIYGDGNAKVILVDEDDIATYTIKSIDDPHMVNKILHIMPPKNIICQNELFDIWEKLTGKKLNKSTISEEAFLTMKKGDDYTTQFMTAYCHPIYYKHCLRNFKISEGEEEASKLYPNVKYSSVEEYLKRYL